MNVFVGSNLNFHQEKNHKSGQILFPGPWTLVDSSVGFVGGLPEVQREGGPQVLQS